MFAAGRARDANRWCIDILATLCYLCIEFIMTVLLMCAGAIYLVLKAAAYFIRAFLSLPFLSGFLRPLQNVIAA